MSAPGAPPETGFDFSQDEGDEGQVRTPYRGAPNLFDSNMGGEFTPPLTNDERFAPGTPPNMAGQLTVPDDPTPGRFPEQQRGPLVGPPPTDQELQDPNIIPSQRDTPAARAARTSIFSPVPIADRPVRMGRAATVDKGTLFDPESVAEQEQPLRNAPKRTRYETNPDSALGRAVDRATGMEGMHEKVNQADLMQY